MPTRFWWLDDTDRYEAKRKLGILRRKQLAKWEWVRWCENDFPVPRKGFNEEAASDLLREIGVISPFRRGKVIYTYALPRFHALLSNHIGSIPEHNLLVIICRPDKTCSLYKKAKKMDMARIDGPMVVTKASCLKMIMNRASEMDGEIDEHAAKMMIDFVGTNPNRLQMELEKTLHLAPNRRVSPWVVEQSCHGDGEADARNLARAILEGKLDLAHEFARRAMNSTHRTSAFLIQWARKLMIASSCGASCGKDVMDKLSEMKRIDGTPLYPKPGAMSYACKELLESGRGSGWTAKLMRNLWRLEIEMRTTKQVARLLHGLVDECGYRTPASSC